MCPPARGQRAGKGVAGKQDESLPEEGLWWKWGAGPGGVGWGKWGFDRVEGTKSRMVFDHYYVYHGNEKADRHQNYHRFLQKTKLETGKGTPFSLLRSAPQTSAVLCGTQRGHGV